MLIRGILPLLLLAAPAGFADTLILRDGAQIRGSFNSANSTQINFTDDTGRRRTVDLRDVQELRFSSSGQPLGGPPLASSAMVDDLDRLRQDLRSAMDRNNLPPDQRQSLEDAREVLRAAAQQARLNKPIQQRNVRLALDSIRNSAGGMQRDDQFRLTDDIRRLSASLSTQPGRDY